MFTKYKYPRTQHLPYSESLTDDDKRLDNDDIFKNMEIVITEKMDGENTTIYSNGDYHARSLDSKHKEYHSWLLSYIPTFSYLIPENYRICGEYLYAKHSIYYENLENYFYVFSVWNGDDCLSWEETEKFCNNLNLHLVPVLYKGIYDKNICMQIAKDILKSGGEGFVVRNINGFKYADFGKNVAKFVRKNHVQTDIHWTNSQIIPNQLKTQN